MENETKHTALQNLQVQWELLLYGISDASQFQLTLQFFIFYAKFSLVLNWHNRAWNQIQIFWIKRIFEGGGGVGALWFICYGKFWHSAFCNLSTFERYFRAIFSPPPPQKKKKKMRERDNNTHTHLPFQKFAGHWLAQFQRDGLIRDILCKINSKFMQDKIIFNM